jgi:aryl-alcohol dehydrogenase-like predicted oxidoreductase
LLTGKFTADTKFEPNDHRNFNADGKSFNAGETFSGIQFSKGLQLVEEIKQLLPDDRLAQWAVRWILDHPQVTTVIPGASKIYQVRSNMEASSLPPLGPDVHAALRELYDERIKPQIRGHY